MGCAPAPCAAAAAGELRAPHPQKEHSPARRAATTRLLLAAHVVPAPRLGRLGAGPQASLPKVADASRVAQHCGTGKGGVAWGR